MFSARLDNFSLPPATTTVNGAWIVADPYYNLAGFSVGTGIFTVPVTGFYAFKININYNTTAAINAQLGGGVDPAFFLRRTAVGVVDLTSGNFPLVNVNIALLLTLRVILGNGQVNLTGDFHLNAGDTIALIYSADGLPITLTLGEQNPPGIVYSSFRIAAG